MLNEFRSTSITWDKATSRIYSPVTANASDENGRKLVVQIVNSGQVEDLNGATLHLYWETRDKAHDGLDVFKAVDLKKGEFELSYTTGMLSNQGVLNANLVLIDTVGRVVSERFKITVTEGIDNDAIQSEDSFSSLTQALIDVSNLEQNYAPRLNDLTAQLQQKANKADLNIVNRKVAPLRYGELKMPSDFTPVLPCKFYRDNDGLIKHNMNFNKYKGGTKIYVKSTGNDATGTGSESTPYKTLLKAKRIALAGYDNKYEIITDIEMFNRDEFTFTETVTNKTIAFVSTNPNKTTISSNASYVWTVDGTGTYKTSRSSTGGVTDNLNKDVYGLPLPLKQVFSLSICQNTVNTWYSDGTSIWVHRIDGIMPTVNNTIVSIGVASVDFKLSNATVYFENFTFVTCYAGNGLRASGALADTVCFNNCFFVSSNQSSPGNGLAIVGVGNTYSFDCIAAYAQLDGFNYHYDGIALLSDRKKCFALEYNCKAYHLGIEVPGAGSNNASSCHDTANILRIGTIGYYNTGGTIIDVTGCYSILYDCHARSPVTNGVTGVGSAFAFTSEGTGLGLGKTYMYNCSATDADISLTVSSTHTVYVNNFKHDGAVTGSGAINYF